MGLLGPAGFHETVAFGAMRYSDGVAVMESVGPCP